MQLLWATEGCLVLLGCLVSSRITDSNNVPSGWTWLPTNLCHPFGRAVYLRYSYPTGSVPVLSELRFRKTILPSSSSLTWQGSGQTRWFCIFAAFIKPKCWTLVQLYWYSGPGLAVQWVCSKIKHPPDQDLQLPIHLF
jgi:hypothetical protein